MNMRTNVGNCYILGIKKQKTKKISSIKKNKGWKYRQERRNSRLKSQSKIRQNSKQKLHSIFQILSSYFPMENLRPKSGLLRTGPAEDRRYSNKYQDRRYSKDICKSINILPIKILNQNIANEKTVNDTLKTLHTTSMKNGWISNNKQNGQNKRKTLLSIKSKPSLKLQDPDDFRLLMEQNDMILSDNKLFSNATNNKNIKRPSIDLSHSNTPQIYNEEDTDKLFDMLHKKKDIMMLDHKRLVMEATKFKSLLNDFQSRFKELKTDKESLSEKVNKYEQYFKEMRLRHLPLTDEEESVQKNQQLKILNLQKKVQTLNYIIKQYRTNNNHEIKGFQQRLKDFKPNIEKQLTQKLAETNQKYHQLLKKVEFFQSQCNSTLKTNWHQLMNDFQQTKTQNQQHLQCIMQLNQQVTQLNQLMQHNQQKIQLISKLQDQNLNQKSQLEKIIDRKLELQELIEQKDIKIDQLNHLYEETSFKLEGLQNLQFRIQNKDKTIKKNTIIINRLQCQNIELKSKMDTVLSDFQSRIFCQKNLQDHLSKANNTIHELTNRLHETLIDFAQNSSQFNKQKQHFIGHLFDKVKTSYNQIISEYQNQLKLVNVQCDKWKETFEMISKNREEKVKYIGRIKGQIEKIQEKKVRCQDNFNKQSNEALDYGRTTNKQCQNCKHLIAYWGQLQNSYSQLKHILEGIMRMEQLNPTQPLSLAGNSDEESTVKGENRRLSQLYAYY